ncbi:MAG: formylglycine-generating enzyme family protein [bacterium]
MKYKAVYLFLIFILIFKLKVFAEDKTGNLSKLISPPPARTAMILIPAGEFIMGYNDGNSDENPEHKVYLDAFYMDKYEVSNKDYQKFIRETDYPAPEFWYSKEYKNFNKPDHPVVGVSFEDAFNYALWAKKRLPTEAEWEKACRGDSSFLYPWGDKKPDKSLGNFCSEATVDSKSFPEGVSPYGIYNMLGNVWEWCSDWYDENYYKSAPYQNPSSPKITGRRVLRGGSFLCSLDILRATLRGYADPKDKAVYYGFRCAKDVK